MWVGQMRQWIKLGRSECDRGRRECGCWEGVALDEEVGGADKTQLQAGIGVGVTGKKAAWTVVVG